MSSFNTMYKKTSKQLLIPKGYSIWKSVFYKEVDNNICFFVHGKKVNHSNVSSAIVIYVDAGPSYYSRRVTWYHVKQTTHCPVCLSDSFLC